MLNLLSNALKFTEENGKITISCSTDEEFIKISVKDTGIGISEENKKKLFKLFGFLESSKDKNPNGVGLGLAISQKIVHEFDGGDFELESKEGFGSKFTFKFRMGKKQNYNTTITEPKTNRADNL